MKGKLNGNTLPELLVVLVLSGVLAGFVFDAVILLRRRMLPLVTDDGPGRMVQTWHLEQIERMSDSCVFREGNMLFYRAGICTDTLPAADTFILREVIDGTF